MDKKEKESYREKYIHAIKQSWTFSKLTNKEIEKVLPMLCQMIIYADTEQQIYDEIRAVYLAYLVGLGYNAEKDLTDLSYEWRKDNDKINWQGYNEVRFCINQMFESVERLNKEKLSQETKEYLEGYIDYCGYNARLKMEKILKAEE